MNQKFQPKLDELFYFTGSFISASHSANGAFSSIHDNSKIFSSYCNVLMQFSIVSVRSGQLHKITYQFSDIFLIKNFICYLPELSIWRMQMLSYIRQFLQWASSIAESTLCVWVRHSLGRSMLACNHNSQNDLKNILEHPGFINDW